MSSLFCTMEHFLSHRTKVFDGSRCGGKEGAAGATRRRLRILIRRILCYERKED